MDQAASDYLRRLHEMVKAYPEQWQAFGKFFLEIQITSDAPVR